MKNTLKIFQLAWKTRRAWWFTATSRTRERFARTALGSFWLGLSTLLSVGALALVYGTVFRVQDFPAYVVYLGLGLVAWNSVSGAVTSAPLIFRVNAGNIKNTNIHPIFFSLEEWAFQVQTFLQSFGLVFIAMCLVKPSLAVNMITSGLLPLINILLFMYWLPLLICLLGAEYEDLFQLLPIIVQLVFLVSPILYERKALGSLGWIADVNPLYILTDSLRSSLINGNNRPFQALLIFTLNVTGIVVSTWILELKRRKLPFLT